MTQESTSKTRMTERLQEYYDAIIDIHSEKGCCTLLDLAGRLNVVKSTTYKALIRLVEIGKIRSVCYGRNRSYYEPASTPTRGQIAEFFARLREHFKDEYASPDVVASVVWHHRSVWQ